jgi:iron complex outermembrane receptor protein
MRGTRHLQITLIIPISVLLLPLSQVYAATNEPAALHVEVVAPMLTAAPATSDAWTGAPLLANLPGVAVRSQGFASPQTDLSIRGNPFNAGGLLLAGATLCNPQTEHFQADLAVPGEYFLTPELLTGLERFRAAPGHLAGSVALTFAPAADYHGVAVGLGEAGQRFGRFLFTETAPATNGAVSAVSGFGSWDRIARTDGQSDNDLERWAGGGHAQYRTDTAQADLLATYSCRTFGARGFYGANPDYPAEEDVRQWLAVAGVTLSPAPDSRWRASLAWQQTEDQYWLNRTNHALYANTHRSQTVAGQLATRQPLTAHWAFDARLDADWQWIDSRYEGTIPAAGLGIHERGHLAFALLPEWIASNWRVTAGGAVELFTDDEPAWLPAAGIAWSPVAGQTLFASCTAAERRPSYTELNYESPDSLGNSGLQRARMRTCEAGWRATWPAFDCRVTVFAEDGRNMVDWIRASADSRWTAANLARVRTLGAAADAALALTDAVELTLRVLLLHKESDTDLYASRYALDYPTQELRLGLRLRLTPDLGLRLWQGAAHYADNAARTGRDCQFASGVEARWRLACAPGLTLAAGAVNIWDEAFEVFPGQPEVGRRAYTSLAYTW